MSNFAKNMFGNVMEYADQSHPMYGLTAGAGAANAAGYPGLGAVLGLIGNIWEGVRLLTSDDPPPYDASGNPYFDKDGNPRVDLPPLTRRNIEQAGRTRTTTTTKKKKKKGLKFRVRNRSGYYTKHGPYRFNKSLVVVRNRKRKRRTRYY